MDPALGSERLSLLLLRSRAPRRGREGGQCAWGSGQQVQRPAALSLLSSELGPHGSGRAAQEGLPGAAPARPAGALPVGPPSARGGPGRGRPAGAPPPRSREPARPAAAAERGSGRVAPAGRPPPPPLRRQLAPTDAGQPPLGSPSLPSPAPSGGAHRWEAPTEVSIPRVTEEAERDSTPAAPGTPPAPTRLARALRCALMRGRRARCACARRGRPSSPGRPATPEPFTFGLGWRRVARPGCRLERAWEKTTSSGPCSHNRTMEIFIQAKLNSLREHRWHSKFAGCSKPPQNGL